MIICHKHLFLSFFSWIFVQTHTSHTFCILFISAQTSASRRNVYTNKNLCILYVCICCCWPSSPSPSPTTNKLNELRIQMNYALSKLKQSSHRKHQIAWTHEQSKRIWTVNMVRFSSIAQRCHWRRRRCACIQAIHWTCIRRCGSARWVLFVLFYGKNMADASKPTDTHTHTFARNCREMFQMCTKICIISTAEWTFTSNHQIDQRCARKINEFAHEMCSCERNMVRLGSAQHSAMQPAVINLQFKHSNTNILDAGMDFFHCYSGSGNTVVSLRL